MDGESVTTSTESSTSEATTTATATNEAVAAGETTALGGEAQTTGTETATTEASETAAETKEGDSAEETEAPAVPENYELTAPEGFTLDPADVEAAAPIFKELGLSNDQAQQLMPAAAKFAEGLQAKFQQNLELQAAATRTEWLTAAKADPEIGGAKFDESVSMAAKALDAFGAPAGSPFRQFLNESGLGNHPEAVRMFAKIGRAIGEDSNFVRGDSGAQVKPNKAELLYPDDVRKGA